MALYNLLNRNHPADTAAEDLRKRTIAGLRCLSAALAVHFPQDTNRMRTVRIGTWNIREFGNTN